MSEADILTALDGWLGDAEAPPANMTKHDLTSRADALSMVIKPVTTVSAVVKREVANQVATETAPSADNETLLCEARAQALMAKGIPAQSAEMLAFSLMRRDRQLDDRRSCAECASFHGGGCLQRITPIGETTIHTLHRCRGFKLSEGFND